MNIEQEHALLPCPFCGGEAKLIIGFPPLKSSFVDCPTCDASGRIYEKPEEAIEHWNRRAALQSQSVKDGWKEAAIAWEVCASLHREYCKGKDPFFKTRQADFARHADDARKRFSESDTPQTQPQADPSEWIKQHEALMHRVSKAALVVGYGGTINGTAAEQTLENAEKALLDHALALQSQDREDVTTLKAGLEEAAQTMRAVLAQERLKAVAKRCLSRAIVVCDRAIDRARRIEGES